MQYKVLELSYINGRLVLVGDVVEYGGEAASNLRLLEAAEDAKENKKASK